MFDSRELPFYESNWGEEERTYIPGDHNVYVMGGVNICVLRFQFLEATSWTGSCFENSSKPPFTINHTSGMQTIKLTYLRDEPKGGPAMYVIQGLIQTAECYGEDIKCFENCYNHHRVTHHEHVWNILQAPIMKGNNGRELCRLCDVCKQHIWAIELSDHFDLEMFLAIKMEMKMTRLKWMRYSNDSNDAPPYFKFLKFLDMQALNFESVTFECKPQTTTYRSYVATVHCKKACVACSRGNHPLGICWKFQGRSQVEWLDMAMKAALR